MVVLSMLLTSPDTMMDIEQQCGKAVQNAPVNATDQALLVVVLAVGTEARYDRESLLALSLLWLCCLIVDIYISFGTKIQELFTFSTLRRE